MGYSTRFSLKITPLTGATRKPKSLEEVISELRNGVQIDREKIIRDLQEVNTKQLIVVQDTDIINELRSTNENAKYCLDEEGEAEDSAKWYEHETDFRLFSKQHPEWLFKLTGEGEEVGDMWIKYFVNGKMQEAKARITYDEFDMQNLR